MQRDDTPSVSMSGHDLEMGTVWSRDGAAQTAWSSQPLDPSQPQMRRVRGVMRCAAPDQFSPQIVPIGPYHAGQVGSYLLQSTGVKDKYVQGIIQKQGVCYGGLKAAVTKLVNEVRPYYTHLPEGTMNNREEFSKMLLRDGCYLLCHLINFDRPVRGSSSSGGGGGGSSSSGASGSNGDGGSSSGSGGSGSRSGDVGGDITHDPMGIDNNDNTLETHATHDGVGEPLSGCLVSWWHGVRGMFHGAITTLFNGQENGGGGAGSRSGSRSCDVGGDIGANQMSLDNDNTLVRDILYLLENQIPLAVLEAILNNIYGTQDIDYAPRLIYEPVRDMLQQQKYISPNRQPVPSSSMSTPFDLLHLVYSYFRRGRDDVPPAWTAQPRFLKSMGRWRRATDYRKYADLKFSCREFQGGLQWTILDILHIEGGTLYIPFLQVNTDTFTMLRNLMALEEQEQQRPVTAYCFFLSQVACTAEDVQLLQGAGILQHFMANDKEAANAFAYLCSGVAMDVNSLERNYLKHLWHVLDQRSSKQVHNFTGFFREKYCSTVFYRLVFLVAILVFVSEVTQAIYTVIGYHKPKRN